MNKTGMRVYNINSQGSFCSSELLLNGSEQSSRQIGRRPSNRVDIRLSLIRTHQRLSHSAAPLITAARDWEVLQPPRSRSRACFADLLRATPTAAQPYQARLRSSGQSGAGSTFKHRVKWSQAQGEAGVGELKAPAGKKRNIPRGEHTMIPCKEGTMTLNVPALFHGPESQAE